VLHLEAQTAASCDMDLELINTPFLMLVPVLEASDFQYAKLKCLANVLNLKSSAFTSPYSGGVVNRAPGVYAINLGNL